MKNHNWLFIITFLIVLFTHNSCEKENLTGTTGLPRNDTIVAKDSIAIESDNSGFTVTSIEVFNGVAPTEWTDIDISPAVGENYAMAILKIHPLSSNIGLLAYFRQNGDTTDYLFGSDTENMVSLGSSGAGQVIIYTDSIGIIEWKSYDPAYTKIEVVAYIR